jgi:hypothetical protein
MRFRSTSKVAPRWLCSVLFLVAAIAASAWLLNAAGKTPAAIRFLSAGERSGLTSALNNGATPRKYLPETMAGGIAAFDYNGDGRLDLFFTNGASLPSLVKSSSDFSNHLFRNDGDGRFTDVTTETGLAGAGYTIGAAAGDFDNDGWPDLFVAGVNESHLYRNRGGKQFEDVTLRSGIRDPGWAIAAGWLDYDRDGLLDLFVVNYLKWSPASNPSCTDPSGRYVVYCSPAKFAGASDMLFHNLGGGRFEDVSASSGIAAANGKGMSLAIADYDGDGFPDVFVTNDILPNFLFHNLRNGRFEESALTAGVALPDNGNAISGMGTDFRDYDNDGRPDIIFTALAGQTFPLFKNLGKGLFEDATVRSKLGSLTGALSGWGIALADLNNDGFKDLFTANSHVTDNIALFSGDRYELPNRVFANCGDGTFADVSSDSDEPFQHPRAHRGLVVADFDGDGKLDAVVSVLNGRPEFWRNATPNSGHWLNLKLQGVRSNRSAIGAQVRIGDQWNDMTSAVGYASSSLAPVHFGLGQHTRVPEIEIHWPDGARQVLTDIAADQTLVVREAESASAGRLDMRSRAR